MNKIEARPDFQFMRLGDILIRVVGLKRRISEGKDEGKYPLFYASHSNSKNKKYFDDYDYEDLSLIVMMIGKPKVFLEKKFNVSSSFGVYRSIHKEIRIEYVYYYLHSNLYILESLLQGTTIKKITYRDFEGIVIPIIPLEKQEELITLMEKTLKSLDDEKTAENIYANLDLKDISYPTKIFNDEFVEGIMFNILNRYMS